MSTKDIIKVWWKEIRVAILIGIALFLVNGIRIFLQYNGELGTTKALTLCLVLGISLVLTVMVSKSIGCILPIITKRINLDPAVVAAPIITTIIDLCSIVIYFQIATLFFTEITASGGV